MISLGITFLLRLRPDSSSRAEVLRVNDPKHFRFHSYLSKRLVTMFVDLVEIDPTTWAVCILASPLILVLIQAHITK